MITLPTFTTAVLGSGALGALCTYAALSPQSQTFGRTLIAGTNPRQVALTFDDGPNDACTLAMLEVLAAHNAKAAFFMIGRFVRERPDLVRAVHAAGHIVGNHTDTHPWLAWQSASRIREELRRCNAALEDTLGAPVRYFRPPHGARRPMVLNAARELGLATVQWNAMGNDWELTDPKAIVAHIEVGLSQAQARSSGVNILLHDGHDRVMGADRSATLRATSLLLERFRRTGETIVALDAWDERL